MPKLFTGEIEMHHYQSGLVDPVGRISLDWSFLEALLSRHYVLLVFGDHDFADQAQITITDAFESLPTWRTKCNLLQDAAERRLGKGAAKKLGKLLQTLESAQRRRNNAVHGRWFKAKDEDGVWVRTRGRSGPAEAWDADTFWQVRYDILNGMENLNAFFDEIRKTLKQGTYKTGLAEALRDFKPRPNGNAK